MTTVITAYYFLPSFYFSGSFFPVKCIKIFVATVISKSTSVSLKTFTTVIGLPVTQRKHVLMSFNLQPLLLNNWRICSLDNLGSTFIESYPTFVILLPLE